MKLWAGEPSGKRQQSFIMIFREHDLFKRQCWDKCGLWNGLVVIFARPGNQAFKELPSIVRHGRLCHAVMVLFWKFWKMDEV
jgi:hypothetical protein